MRASRLLSILILLQMRGRASAETLAREFEVSVRTIYRDMDHLSAAGVPVYAERGRTGGFALLDGYRTRLTGFSEAEAGALLLAGIGGAAADLGLGADLTAARLKLLASLPAELGGNAQKVAARFHLDPAGWYSRAERPGAMPDLAAAVWSDRRVRLRYSSWKGVVDREVGPVGLVLKGGRWYLVALVRGKPRTYRVSSILNFEVLDESFGRPARFDLARYWTKAARAFEDQLLAGRAAIRISRAGLALLRDVNPAAAEAVDGSGVEDEAAGWFRAEIPVEGVASASLQLLRLGAEVEVLEPPALREAVIREARKVLEAYRA